MKMLFIVDHNTDKYMDQVIMLVPDAYDRTRVREEAQGCGVPNPNILGEMPIPDGVMRRIGDYTDEYAAYSR